MSECKHEKVMPAFDERAAAGVNDVYEIRRRWPRFDGVCPDCNQRWIIYASFTHYISGDW